MVLRKAGHDVATPVELGISGAPDPVHLTHGTGSVSLFFDEKCTDTEPLLQDDDELSGEDVMPGFRCPIREILPPLGQPEEAQPTPTSPESAMRPHWPGCTRTSGRPARPYGRRSIACSERPRTATATESPELGARSSPPSRRHRFQGRRRSSQGETSQGRRAEMAIRPRIWPSMSSSIWSVDLRTTQRR